MHYIRLLRPPKVRRNAGQHLELLFTITTDLGDSFLYPDVPIDLQIIAEIHELHTPTVLKLTKKSQVVWQSGMRVAKPKIAIPRPLQAALSSGAKVNIRISANKENSADGAQHILLHSENSGSQGQIMPVWATLNDANAGTDVSTRRVVLDDAASGRYVVEVEEEIGESIARHIWDAGVLAMCCIAGIYLCPTLECNQQQLPKAMKAILSSKKALNVLELGCGVGILGLGFATVFPRLRKEGLETCTIVMTDLEEAEERTKSNMERAVINGKSQDMSLLYENLDWEDGRKGVFGTEVAGRDWDLIIISDCTYNVDMLPALVETLTALEMASRLKRGSTAAGTKVFLATKPRHASEREFFDLMSDSKWRVQESQILDLPVLGNENESIELYLFERQ